MNLGKFDNILLDNQKLKSTDFKALSNSIKEKHPPTEIQQKILQWKVKSTITPLKTHKRAHYDFNLGYEKFLHEGKRQHKDVAQDDNTRFSFKSKRSDSY